MLNETEQRQVIRVVSVVQFVAVVDFMMILPLGPDLIEPLGIDPAKLGLIVAAYTVAAAFAGIAGALFFDRFKRRSSLIVGLIGLVLSTLAAAAAVDLLTLGLARAAAGFFGGPVIALGLSIVTDAIPASRRGRAIGAVMGANALGAILGVPIGLWLAEVWCWEAPFLVLGCTGVLVIILVAVKLPSTPNLNLGVTSGGWSSLYLLASRPISSRAFGMIFLVMVASFLVTPNLSAYVQYNLNFPREDIPQLYFIAGASAFVSMRFVGRAVDRWGALGVSIIATIAFINVVLIYLVSPNPLLPFSIGFVVLLVSLSSRNVAVRTLSTLVPEAHERARYLSLQSSVRYLAAAVGALSSSLVLETGEGGNLEGMPSLGLAVIVLSLGALPLLRRVEKMVQERDQASF